MIGSPPYKVFTNLDLDVVLVGCDIETGGHVDVYVGEEDKEWWDFEGAEKKRVWELKESSLPSLREKYTAAKEVAIEFGKILKREDVIL